MTTPSCLLFLHSLNDRRNVLIYHQRNNDAEQPFYKSEGRIKHHQTFQNGFHAGKDRWSPALPFLINKTRRQHKTGPQNEIGKFAHTPGSGDKQMPPQTAWPSSSSSERSLRSFFCLFPYSYLRLLFYDFLTANQRRIHSISCAMSNGFVICSFMPAL